MNQELTRGAGILMAISSLPSKYGIGTMGKAAYEFVDRLKEAEQKYWQVLPIGPTSFGDSPYQTFSIFAGNPYFIDLENLIKDGYLTVEDADSIDYGGDDGEVDYDEMFKGRYILLEKAYKNWKELRSPLEIKEYNEFEKDNSSWLQDYSLFMSCKEYFGYHEWLSWDKDIRNREEKAICEYSKKLEDKIDFWKFLQYRFYSEWIDLKMYANSKGISIIGDIPIYVALDSADVWANTEIFQLDENREPVNVAGCPPDAFSEDGQKWGNPLYDWEKMSKDNFAWWKKRISSVSSFYDIIRIDHFIGIVRYYCIPSDKSAKFGWYEKGPGINLINAIKESVGNAKIIAEDLGVVGPDVEELLLESGYPGMKVLEFAFDGSRDNVYLPHNHVKNSVLYIGTHDNDTLKGYCDTLSEDSLLFLMNYLDVVGKREISDAMIRIAYMSVANTVILQMQDILGKDNSARMNFPSTIGTNWKWRMKEGEFGKEICKKLRNLTDIYGR